MKRVVLSVCLLLLVCSCFAQLQQTEQHQENYIRVLGAKIQSVLRNYETDLVKTLQSQFEKHTCQSDKQSLNCSIQFNQTIAGHHIQFTAGFSVSIDKHNESATIVILFNDDVIYQKTVALQDLVVPICVPVLSKLQLKLCLDFSHIRFSKEKECFSAEASLTLKIFVFKTITIIPPVEFGWNKERCHTSLLAKPVTMF